MPERTGRHLTAQRFVALFFLTLILASILGASRSPVAGALARGERVSMMMLGIDAADLSRHTDTIMVAIVDPLQNAMSFLSIPRDTRIELPGYRFNRVNEIFGYQLRTSKDPAAAAMKTLQGVSYLLDPSGATEITHYAAIDFGGFRKMIDILGGIWVTIDTPMNYDDNAGGYHFHREPGRYLMQGDDALYYVRYRGQTGDRGRILRQQEFLRSLIKRLANPMLVFQIPEMIGVVATSLSTNLSAWDLVYLASAVRRMRSDSVGFYILPGQPHGPYWAPNREAADQLVGLLLHGRPADTADVETIAPQADRVTVKVWNASGRKGLAYKITRRLRDQGYDVVDWGNFKDVQLKTRVVDRQGRLSNAQKVARDLGVEDYHSEPNPSLLVDVEVVIGQNWDDGTR